MAVDDDALPRAGFTVRRQKKCSGDGFSLPSSNGELPLGCLVPFVSLWRRPLVFHCVCVCLSVCVCRKKKALAPLGATNATAIGGGAKRRKKWRRPMLRADAVPDAPTGPTDGNVPRQRFHAHL